MEAPKGHHPLPPPSPNLFRSAGAMPTRRQHINKQFRRRRQRRQRTSIWRRRGSGRSRSRPVDLVLVVKSSDLCVTCPNKCMNADPTTRGLRNSGEDKGYPQAWESTIELLGLVTDIECKIERSLSATKPNCSIPKPGYPSE